MFILNAQYGVGKTSSDIVHLTYLSVLDLDFSAGPSVKVSVHDFIVTIVTVW